MVGETLRVQAAFSRGDEVRTRSGDRTIKWIVVGIIARWHDKTLSREPGIEYHIRSMQRIYGGEQPTASGLSSLEIEPWCDEIKDK